MQGHNKVIIFIASAVGLYLAWFLVYDFWLKPDGQLDYRLTTNIAHVSANLLQMLGLDAHVEHRSRLFIGNKAGVWIDHPCNGLELYALFAGFILVYPGLWRRKLLFIPLGIAIIYGLNIFRVTLLALNYEYSRQSFAFNHKYVFTFVVYSVIFGMWMLWVNRYANGQRSVPAEAKV